MNETTKYFMVIAYGDGDYWDEYYYPMSDEVSKELAEKYLIMLGNLDPRTLNYESRVLDAEEGMDRMAEYPSFCHAKIETITIEWLKNNTKQLLNDINTQLEILKEFSELIGS